MFYLIVIVIVTIAFASCTDNPMLKGTMLFLYGAFVYGMTNLAERDAEKKNQRKQQEETQKAKEAGEAYWKERKKRWAEARQAEAAQRPLPSGGVVQPPRQLSPEELAAQKEKRAAAQAQADEWWDWYESLPRYMKW